VTDVVKTVAQRLRETRQASGVSLSELARRSGVAKATLSQLEQGNGNPTLTTLFTLATSLGMTLGDLIAEPAHAMHLVRAAEGPIVARPAVNARYIDRIPAGPGLIEVYMLHVEPGRDEDSQPHAPGVTEHLFVFRGPLVAGPSTDPVTLEAGDYLSFPGDRPHRYVAHGEPAEALCLVRYPQVLSAPHPPGSNLD
jgi:transcriptional regulator with XRE-family HTH domain